MRGRGGLNARRAAGGHSAPGRLGVSRGFRPIFHLIFRPEGGRFRQRRGGAGQIKQGGHITGFIDERGQTIQHGLYSARMASRTGFVCSAGRVFAFRRILAFRMDGKQTHVPFRNGIFRQAGNFTEHRDAGMAFNGLSCQPAVPRRPDLIEHHPGQSHRFEGGQSGHYGGGRASHLGAVEGKDHRRVKRPRQSRRGAGAGRVASVVQPAVAFDDSDAIRRSLPVFHAEGVLKQRQQSFVRQKERVQIHRPPSRGQTEPGGVNVVRPFLVRNDLPAPLAQGAGQTERKQGFAPAPGQARDDKTGKDGAAHAQIILRGRHLPSGTKHSTLMQKAIPMPGSERQGVARMASRIAWA